MIDAIFGCVARQHDHRLLLVAVLVCLFGSWTALSLMRHRAVHRQRHIHFAWHLLAAAVTGSGMWATHFIAILAFHDGLPTGHDPFLTASSLFVAVALTWAGFAIAALPGVANLWLAGAVVGAGIGAMHYLGMAGLRVPAFKTWDPRLVVLSVLFGVLLGAASLRVALGGRGPTRLALGTSLLALGICGTHFTGVAALHLTPTTLLPIPAQSTSASWTAIALAVATLVILAAAMAGMAIDLYLTKRTARDAARLHSLVDATFEGIIIHQQGRICDLNKRLAELVRSSPEDLLGRPVLSVLPPDWAEKIEPLLATGAHEQQECELLAEDGERVPVLLLTGALDYRGGPAGVIAVRDLRHRREAEARIRQLFYHDPLTGLPNRTLFHEQLNRMLATRHPETIAVLHINLDRFRTINDALGHHVGDVLLCAVAEQLQICLGKDDVLARIGGDEFAIITEQSGEPFEAALLAHRLVEAIAPPFTIAGHQIVTSISLGIAFGDWGMDAVRLQTCADLALARAKEEGRGCWRFFEREMDIRMQARHQLELDLRNALKLGQLELHYQPLVTASGGVLTGFEALLRWNHPERGAVSPSVFIPMAEEIGLITQIGAWVLTRACSDVASWPGTLKVAVNLSPEQFRGGTVKADVAQALVQSGLDPSRLELEVTEGLLLSDDQGVLATLHELRALGVRIAMDDFGTGYSSLSYLRRFPFDKLKIDQSFVHGLGVQEDCAAIVRAVIGLAHALGMSVNAEGVETEEQREMLRAEGCDELQGYLFGKPKGGGEVLGLIDDPSWRMRQSHADRAGN